MDLAEMVRKEINDNEIMGKVRRFVFDEVYHHLDAVTDELKKIQDDFFKHEIKSEVKKECSDYAKAFWKSDIQGPKTILKAGTLIIDNTGRVYRVDGFRKLPHGFNKYALFSLDLNSTWYVGEKAMKENYKLLKPVDIE